MWLFIQRPVAFTLSSSIHKLVEAILSLTLLKSSGSDRCPRPPWSDRADCEYIIYKNNIPDPHRMPHCSRFQISVQIEDQINAGSIFSEMISAYLSSVFLSLQGDVGPVGVVGLPGLVGLKVRILNLPDRSVCEVFVIRHFNI